MKKKSDLCFAAISLALAMCLLFSACGGKNPPESTEPADTTLPVESESTEDLTEPTEVIPETTQSASGPSAEMGVGERGDYDDDDSGSQPTKPSGGDPSVDTTEPVESKPVVNKPEETKPQVTVPSGDLDPDDVTMEMWDAMTDQQQDDFMASFPTLRDFMNWFNSAKEKEATGDVITSDDDKIDLGELIKP